MALAVKNLPANARGVGRSPGGGNGNPLQYSSLGNSVDRGAWQAAVHRISKSDMTEQLNTHYTHSVSGSLLDILISLVSQDNSTR